MIPPAFRCEQVLNSIVRLSVYFFLNANVQKRAVVCAFLRSHPEHAKFANRLAAGDTRVCRAALLLQAARPMAAAGSRSSLSLAAPWITARMLRPSAR
jgi:hypothetical protein